MIYSLTMNPALDLTGDVEHLIPNEKNYVHNERRSPGGNGINAARVAQKFGAKITATGFLGGGVGEEIASMLKDEGLRVKFVRVGDDTRINITVSNKFTGLQTRFSFKGPQVSRQDLGSLLKITLKARPKLVIIGGTLPPGLGRPEFLKLLSALGNADIPFWLDGPSSVLKWAKASKPALIKPNLLEFQELIGRKIETPVAVSKTARDLLKYFSNICISSVQGGAVFVNQRGSWFGRVPALKAKTGLGAGDSMVGAMAAHAGRDGQTLLRWGLAAACATVSHGNQHWPLSLAKSFEPKIKINPL
jgi:1-phosphofructokinase family hexose kinase